MTRKQDDGAIYRRFEQVTRDLTGYVVLRDGESIAKIVVRYGGRSSPNGLTVRAFVHVYGTRMVEGIARGGGYDMRTAAIHAACQKLKVIEAGDIERARQSAMCDAVDAFRTLKDAGWDMPQQLREMGYQVEQVI